MPWVLGPIRPGTTYTDDQTLKCAGSIGTSLRIEWAPVWIQVMPDDPEMRGEAWEPEELFPRGYHALPRRLGAIRVRGALEMVPVLVTITATKAYE